MVVNIYKKVLIFLLVLILLIHSYAFAEYSDYDYHVQTYKNDEEFDYCNITQWHEQGFTGKGVKVAVIDTKLDPALRFFDGKVSTAYTQPQPLVQNTHGQQVADIIHQVAPDAEIYSLYVYDEGKAIKWCIENDIDIINLSWSGIAVWNNEDVDAYNEGILLIKSSGNDGSRKK